MSGLYDDVGQPTRIQGYASVYGITYESGGYYQRVNPNAFDLVRYPIFACLRHDRSTRLGATVGRTLAVWQDSHGLAFRLDVPSSALGLGLVAGIRRNVLRGASFSSPADGIRKLDVVHEDGRTVHVFNSIRVEEISLCEAGANPEAVCWLDCEEPEDLPDHIREARARWNAGRVQAAMRPRARSPLGRITAHGGRPARPSAAVLARIDRVLAAERIRR